MVSAERSANKEVFNTSGLVYKEMRLKDKLTSMSEEEQLMLLATHGMLVKRPMVITHDIVLVGFKEADWEGALFYEQRITDKK